MLVSSFVAPILMSNSLIYRYDRNDMRRKYFQKPPIISPSNSQTKQIFPARPNLKGDVEGDTIFDGNISIKTEIVDGDVATTFLTNSKGEKNKVGNSTDGISFPLDLTTLATSGQVMTAKITTKAKASPSPPLPPSLRECLSIALPAVGIYVFSPLMSLIDTSFVGRVSSLELAALGPASSISDGASLPLLFLSVGTTNLVARHYGKNSKKVKGKVNGDDDEDNGMTAVGERCAVVTTTALSMALAGGTAVALLLRRYAVPISILHCGASADRLAGPCIRYVSIRALALPFAAMSAVAQSALVGGRDARTPLIAVGLAAVLNLAGDFILVTKMGRGAGGAAWATAASQLAAALMLFRALAVKGYLCSPFGREGSFRRAAKDLLQFVPFLFVMGTKVVITNSCAAAAASLGGAPAAAHTAVLAVATLCWMSGDMGSTLCQTFLPPFLSSGATVNTIANTDTDTDTNTVSTQQSNSPSFDMESAKPTLVQLLKCTWGMSAVCILLSSALLTVLAPRLTSDPTVIAEMGSVLPIVATVLAMHGTVVTLEGLVLARGRPGMLAVSYALIGATITAMLKIVGGGRWGLRGVWSCYLWFQVSRAAAFTLIGGLVPSLPLPFLRKWRRKSR